MVGCEYFNSAFCSIFVEQLQQVEYMPKLKETITLKSIVGYITIISTVFGAGYSFHLYMLNQQKQIISQLTPQFEVIDSKLTAMNTRIDKGFQLNYIRDTMQINAFDRYKMQQASNESQRVKVLSEILKQVKEREPYYMLFPDTSKKKIYMSNR